MSDHRLSPEITERIDATCDQFEKAWTTENRLHIEALLRDEPAERVPHLLRELLLLEVKLRSAQSESPSAKEYNDRFPQHREIVDAIFGEITRTHHSNSKGSGRLEVRCPSCHTPTEVAVDTTLTDLTCDLCGSHFSLVDQTQATRLAPSLTKLGRFELIERVGVGGFGSVWKSLDKELDRTVAIKIPRAGGMTAEEQEKFFREARAAAQLRHPNIVSVHEVGRDGDSVYIVSDFVRGVTLGDWLTGQQPTNREAAELCAKIAEALQHAHECGIVHRDLKLANIMIDGDGEPHLMDFGLARRDVGEVTVTIDGQVLGTPAYMSPEQARGEAHTADRRSDIYSLGVVLFKLLTGELPFRGNARMLMHQVIHDEPPSPRKLNGSVHRDIETITLKCLEKEPLRRYQTCSELANEFERFLRGEPIQARPVGHIEKTWRWCQRNPLAAGLSLATFAALSIGLVVSSLLGIEAKRQWQVAQRALATEQDAKQQAMRSKEEALREKNQATRSLYYALMMAIPRQVDATRFDMARKQLLDAPAEYRSWEWGYFARLCNLDLATFKDSDDVMAVAFSPDGSTFATGGKSGLCTIYDWPTAKPRNVLKTEGGSVNALAYSPTGRSLVTGQANLAANQGRVSVWDVTSGRELLTLKGHEGGVKCVGFSRDGKLIASGGYDRTARVWNANTGEQLHVLEKHGGVVKSLAFSPTADILVTADKDGDNIMRVWNPVTGEKLAQLPPSDRWGTESLAFSPDGKTLAAGKKAGDVELWAVDKWQLAESINLGKAFVWAIAYSPDGKLLSCGIRDPAVLIYSLADKKVKKTIRGHGLYANAVAFSNDSRFLLTGSSDGTSKLWSVDGMRETTDVRVTSKGVYPRVVSARYTPDDKAIVTATTEDKFVRVWDTKTGDERMRLGPHPSELRSMDISHDGNTVALATNGVRLWNLLTGDSRLLSINDHDRVEWVSFSPDSTKVAAVHGNKALLWDVRSGKIVKSFSDGQAVFAKIYFCPTDKMLATITASEPARVSIWNLDELHAPVFSREFRQKLYAACFSTDGNQIAIASGHSPVVVDVKTGRELFSLVGHEDIVSDIAYSPDKARIATVSVAGAVSVWNAEDGQELLNLGRKGLSFYCTEFSADGKQLALGGRLHGGGAGVQLLTAYPWTKSGAIEFEDLTLERSFDLIKRSELGRQLSGNPIARPPIEYTLKKE